MEKVKSGKNLGIGLLRRSIGNPSRSVGNPSRGVALRRSVECLAVARLRCSKGHPSGTLLRSLAVVVLLRGVDTVHSEQISDFCF